MTISAVDPSLDEVTAAIAAAAAPPSAYDRAAGLSKAYRETLRDAWSRSTREVAGEVGGIRSRRDRERGPVHAAYDERANQLETHRRASADLTAQEIGKARDQHRDFLETSNAVLTGAWESLRRAIAIAKPNVAAPSTFMGSGGQLVPDSDYRTCRDRVRALPSFRPLEEDFDFLRAIGIASGVAFLLGIWLFGSLNGGLATALWMAAGGALWRLRRLRNAKELFERLAVLTPLEQAKRRAAMEARIVDLNRRQAEVAARAEEDRSAAQAERDSKLGEIDARYVAPLADARRAWEGRRDAFAGALAAWGEGVGAALATQPARLGEWSAVPGAAEPKPALSDQLRIRLGSEQLPPLPPLDKADADLIGSTAAPPPMPPVRPPLFYDLGRQHSMLLYDHRPARDGASAILGSVVARMLMQLPPGKLNLTLFDPVGLGRNYSPFLALGDYLDLLIDGKVWSEKEHLRRKLKGLIEHIETVTQIFLRADFADIETYNRKAGEIAEAYRLLIISDFPEGFDEESTKDLVRILQNGARCGVYALIHVNRGAPLPYGVDLAVLEAFCVRLDAGEDDAHLLTEAPGAAEARPVMLDGAPPAPLVAQIVQNFGRGAVDAKRVEVPFGTMLQRAAIGEDRWWSDSAENGIAVPLGPKGAKQVQTMVLGSGLAHHALLVGRPGSGKSNLIHVFIATLARLYRPEEVQLYLVDFKKGVEFKAYAESKLPHARVIAVESEREFGHSVLAGLDSELKRRGEMFRLAGVNSFSEYRQKPAHKRETVFPRIILIVDEFQEFFSREDSISRDAGVLFDRLVRQGRAFGIHLILGTQSLANAGLPKSTRDQMAVRIALQCSEADSRLILADDNIAARGLTRPGEAIYNDKSGLVEGNQQFQVALFSEDDRSRELSAISAIATRENWDGEPPLVFEGHEPANIEACVHLRGDQTRSSARALSMWLGEPTSLKEATAAILHRQSGRNMLLLTRDEKQAIGVALAALMSIAAQCPPDRVSFRIVDFTTTDAEWDDYPEAFAEAVPHHAEIFGKRDLKTMLPELEALVADRVKHEQTSEPAIVLVIIGLHRARDLRTDEMPATSMRFDAEPTANLPQSLEKILQDGPEVGVHTILWCDSFGSLDRVIDRQGLNKIGLRVSAALSTADSHRLFDEDLAARIDKPHRLVKFDDEQIGLFDLFRPYALPSPAFLREFGARLRDGDSGAGNREKESG